MNHWLVIGGGPSIYERSLPRLEGTVITANAGYKACAPHVYWLSDPVAIQRFRPFWEDFDGEVVCNEDRVHELRAGRRTTRFPYLEKGQTFHGRCSGVLCCRVAIARGAKRLSLIGFDGYDPDDWLIGVDGKPVQQRGEQALKVNEAQARAFADIAAKHPDVSVTVYGPTRIQMPGAWEML